MNKLKNELTMNSNNDKIKIIKKTQSDHIPEVRSWYYDSFGVKRDKETHERVEFESLCGND